MRKLMMLAAMLALAFALAIPAIAQVDLDTENEAESEGIEAAFNVSNEGDFASQCVPAQQFGNTGNFNNSPSFLQYDSEGDDFEAGGIEVGFGGEQAVECSNTVQQSSAASS